MQSSSITSVLYWRNSTNFKSHGNKTGVMSDGKLMTVHKNAFFNRKMERLQHQLALTEAAHHTAILNQGNCLASHGTQSLDESQ